MIATAKSLNAGTLYGRVVPGLGLLYGLSVGFGAPGALSRTLLTVLIVVASTAWLFTGGCGRNRRRSERRAARRGMTGTAPAAGPAETPQDVLPGERGSARMPVL